MLHFRINYCNESNKTKFLLKSLKSELNVIQGFRLSGPENACGTNRDITDFWKVSECDFK